MLSYWLRKTKDCPRYAIRTILRAKKIFALNENTRAGFKVTVLLNELNLDLNCSSTISYRY